MGPGLQVPFSQKCEEKLDLRTQHISESACTAHLRGSHTWLRELQLATACAIPLRNGIFAVQQIRG